MTAPPPAPEIADPERRRRVLIGLAANPATPPEVLARLIRLPEPARAAASHRTDLTDDLANALIDLGDPPALHSLVLNEHLPLAARQRLAAHPDPGVRAAVARHLPPEMLATLAADAETSVRAAVAWSGSVTDELRRRLLDDPAPSVRRAVARNWWAAPEPARRAMLTDTDLAVRLACLANHPSTLPADLQPGLLADPATRAEAVRTARLTAPESRSLAGDADPRVRRAVASRGDVPADVSDSLAADPDLSVRLHAVTSRGMREPARSEAIEEMWAAAERAGDRTLRIDFPMVWMDFQLTGWVRTAPLDERLALLDSPHVPLRRALATSPGLPPDAARRLLDDPDVGVRQLAARFHGGPAEVLERIVTVDGDWQHIEPGIMDHPDFPAAAYRRFATADRDETRSFALCDPDLPAAVVGLLAHDPDRYVRCAAAGHPNLPVACLAILLNDEDDYVVECAAESSNMPVSWMYAYTEAAGL